MTWAQRLARVFAIGEAGLDELPRKAMRRLAEQPAAPAN
jgi:hypothetical protein